MTLKYIASLIAGAALSLALLTCAKDLTSNADAQIADPNVFSVFQSPERTHLVATVFDDGKLLQAGAHFLKPEHAQPLQPRVTVYRTVYYQRAGWWTRGPIRRLVSWPWRRLAARRCR